MEARPLLNPAGIMAAVPGVKETGDTNSEIHWKEKFSMMMFLAGFILGALITFVLISSLTVASDADDQSEEYFSRMDEQK